MHLSAQLALNADATAIFVILGILTLAATAALFSPAVRRNNATFAPCIVIVVVAVSSVSVGLLSAVAYRMMGF